MRGGYNHLEGDDDQGSYLQHAWLLMDKLMRIRSWRHHTKVEMRMGATFSFRLRPRPGIDLIQRNSFEMNATNFQVGSSSLSKLQVSDSDALLLQGHDVRLMVECMRTMLTA